MLKLFAVDPPGTRIHEDGFSITVIPENPDQFIVTIASVIPKEISPNKKMLVRNFRKESWDTNPYYFLEYDEREKLSLKPDKALEVAFIRYSFDSDACVIQVGIDTATAELYSYEEFMKKSQRFARAQKRLEGVIYQDDHIAYKYQTKNEQADWNNENNACSRLIFGISETYNLKMTLAAFDGGMPTLRMQQDGAKFDVSHNRARFSGPLRRAASYINMRNFANQFQEKPLITREQLESMGFFSTEPV